MDTNSFIVGRFKAQINKFSGIISKGLSKPKQHMVQQLLYGIQAAKDIKISNIARSLNEPIPIIKTEDRLCRNLAQKDISEYINDKVLHLAQRHIQNWMVIAIDPGDINKPYAKEMEYLCDIYDGDKHLPASGYHLCQVTAANLEHDKVIPMYCKLYSTSDGYSQATRVITDTIDKVIKVIGRQGIWAIDRQGDNNEIISHFILRDLTFITRLKGDRGLRLNRNQNNYASAEKLHFHIKKWYQQRIIKIDDGKETEIPIELGAIDINLVNGPQRQLKAVVIKGFGIKPMVLITNREFDSNNPFVLTQILDQYLTRWKCDECFRYIKQSYNLEDIRVRSYNALRNLIAITNAIAYFTSIFLGYSVKLRIMVNKVLILSKRFFGIPSFYQYALADGIYNLLKGYKKYFGWYSPLNQSPLSHDFQLSLFPT